MSYMILGFYPKPYSICLRGAVGLGFSSSGFRALCKRPCRPEVVRIACDESVLNHKP